MFNYHLIKNNEEGYCVLHEEGKGYYLSKVEIVTSLNYNPVEVGSKKDCENFIKKVNFLNIMNEWRKWEKKNVGIINNF